MNVLYLLVSLGKSLTFWQTMDEVIKIFVIVAAIAFAAYQNYAKKEKKELQIPEYLFRYSSTFFKTATKKDLLVKKFFNNDKKDLE